LEIIMSAQLEFYLQRAAEARAIASAATLDNVRDRWLLSEASWTEMAARCERSEKMRAKLIAEKATGTGRRFDDRKRSLTWLRRALTSNISVTSASDPLRTLVRRARHLSSSASAVVRFPFTSTLEPASG
jgi:hypothetical protein